MNAHSSQQYVTIFGTLTQPDPGSGRNPWFKATVPAVDIDWEKHAGEGHENDEDTWAGICPVTTNQSQRTKIIVRSPKDDLSLVPGRMTLECWPADIVRFLREDGVTALWSEATISDSETPLTLYVDPQKVGPFRVTLLGPSDDKSNRPTDYLFGKAVLVDLDVDADSNGAINEADDPLEETPGGILATGTVKQVTLNLAPAGLTGTLKLLAASGGGRIRVWRDAGKTSAVAMPAEWNLSGGYTFPTTLYVEGINASAAPRDVHLRLRYTSEGNQQIDDDIRLTVFKVDLITPAGDPVNAAVQSGDGQNEFTYSSANPGVLTMNLKARVAPSGMASQIKDQCLFTVDTITGSTLAWGSSNPNGKPTANGDDLLATVTFTGLPVNNTAFGNKKAAVYFNTRKQDEKNYEVFFPKQERNHPGTGSGSTPNWYYYWAGAAVPGYDLTSGTYSYADGSADDYAQYNGNPNNPHYTIHGPASAGHEQYNSAGLTVDRKGIDTCAATLVHEKQHRQTDLDWLPGGAWFAKTDGDGDELPDDWEDAHTAQGFDKTKASSFTPAFIYGDDEEVWCEMNALGRTGDGSKDWAKPGKQSKTVF